MTGPVHVIQTVAGLAEATGGPARTIVALSEALAERGVTVDLLAGGVDPMLPDPALVTTRMVTQRRQFAAAIATARDARPGLATIVHDNGIWSPVNFTVTTAARRLGLPYVITPHGMLEPWAMAYHKVRKQVAWALYQRRELTRAVALVATAEAERKAVRRLFPRAPIAVIPNGVRVPVPTAVPLKAAGDPATLLFMSRVHPKKNLPGLLRAWAQLCADPALAHWTLTIAGPDEGGHAAVVKALADRLGIAARVVFAGPVAEGDKAAVFTASDLFVLPSFSENFGIVVTEALAHGVPVVATLGSPWAELPERGCGWWVAPEPDALAGALSEAMHLAPGQRRVMGERGRAWVERAFGWDGIAAQTRDLYSWLLHGGRRPDFVDV